MLVTAYVHVCKRLCGLCEQVEYSYPPVIEGNPVDSHELPQEWKHLPSLALPDGAHNYQKGTVFLCTYIFLLLLSNTNEHVTKGTNTKMK